MSDEIAVRRSRADKRDARALSHVLVDCVQGGASVGFMSPLPRRRAEAFWEDVLAACSRGERIVLVAEERATGAVIGTVQVLLVAPENQPHRGEVSKMLVARSARRQGVGEALMRAAESAALEAGKTLLVLDTASTEAERLYHRLGWRKVGSIPKYALWPGGGFVGTTIFYKDMTPPPSTTPTPPSRT